MPSLTSLPSMPELNPSAETSRASKQYESANIGIDRYKNDKLLAVKSMKHLMEQKKLSDVVQTMGRLQMGLQEPDTRPINGAKEHRLTIMPNL